MHQSIKSILFILAPFILCPLQAMDQELSTKNRRKIYEVALISLLENQNKIPNCPETFLLLDIDQQITDELLLELNPSWKQLDCWSLETKNAILRTALEQHDDASDWKRSRSLIALSICLGAHPDEHWFYKFPLYLAARYQDFNLAKYVLDKGAKPNLKNILHHNTALNECRTCPVAQLLIERGAHIPKDIFDAVDATTYSLELMQFYFDQGVPLDPQQSLLLNISSIPIGDLEIKKASLLIAKGANIATQYRPVRETVFHNISQQKTDASKELCRLFINRYLELHQGFLTFLMHLKKECPTFYKTKGLLKFYFTEAASQLKNVRLLLETKSIKGKTAYDLWPIDELNPANCTYEKLCDLSKGEK